MQDELALIRWSLFTPLLISCLLAFVAALFCVFSLRAKTLLSILICETTSQIIGWVGILVVVLYSVPVLLGTFEEFGVDLTDYVEVTIAVGMKLKQEWFLVLLFSPFLIVFDVTVVALLSRSEKTRPIAKACSAITCFFYLCLILLPSLALFNQVVTTIV